VFGDIGLRRKKT